MKTQEDFGNEPDFFENKEREDCNDRNAVCSGNTSSVCHLPRIGCGRNRIIADAYSRILMRLFVWTAVRRIVRLLASDDKQCSDRYAGVVSDDADYGGGASDLWSCKWAVVRKNKAFEATLRSLSGDARCHAMRENCLRIGVSNPIVDKRKS